MDLIKTLQLKSPLLYKLIMKIQLFVKLAYYRYKRSLLFIISLIFLGHIIYFKGPQPNLKSFAQNDSSLIAFTKLKYLIPPSNLPYKDIGNEIDKFGSMVAEIFGNKRNGTFIEAGANEGSAGSRTLYLEQHLNWTGLLVECNPNVIETLKSHHRKAWISTACLASGTNPGAQNFSIPYESGIFDLWEDTPPESYLEVDTIPLFTLLAALNWTDIDYFSFDIGGNELEVLRTFPFDLITFKLFVIRVELLDAIQKRELDQLMLINNYYFVANFGHDTIFVHWTVKEKLNLKRFSKSWW